MNSLNCELISFRPCFISIVREVLKMNINYLKTLDIMEDTKTKLKKLLDTTEISDFEDEEASYILQKIIEKLEDTEIILEYLNATPKDGILKKNTLTGKFYIEYNNTTNSHPLNYGNILELFYENEWHIGKIACTTKHGENLYYFHGDQKLFLCPGMVVRRRL